MERVMRFSVFTFICTLFLAVSSLLANAQTQTIYEVSQANLQSESGGCNSTAKVEAYNNNCKTAVKRYCEYKSHTSGFGPIAKTGSDTYEIACVDLAVNV